MSNQGLTMAPNSRPGPGGSVDSQSLCSSEGKAIENNNQTPIELSARQRSKEDDMCTPVFTAALFITAKKVEATQMSVIDE